MAGCSRSDCPVSVKLRVSQWSCSDSAVCLTTVTPVRSIGSAYHDSTGQLALTMATGRSIVVNGDLGSGKSTVSTLLAQRLGIRRISVGDLYREMARQRGVTALQLNLRAELDDKIDHYVDRLQSDIAMSGERLVVDSRLAWFFFRDALKVHLIIDPTVAASRVLGRPESSVEGYASVAEARERLAQRSESERVRFIDRYGADKTRLRNYDLVCDSTRATPEDIVARVVEALTEPPEGPRLFIDPSERRLRGRRRSCPPRIRAAPLLHHRRAPRGRHRCPRGPPAGAGGPSRRGRRADRQPQRRGLLRRAAPTTAAIA
jgi:cytidylate kinase